MPSSLTFDLTKRFRDDLLSRNLKPYTIPGYYTPPVTDTTYAIVQSNYSVVDSPDYIRTNPFVDKLHPLNAFGPEGGFDKSIDVGGLANTKSNLGVYDYSDNKLPEISLPQQQKVQSQNRYTSNQGVQLRTINNIQFTPTFEQYADPLSFIPSTYSPYQILLQDNPTGTNGSLSQDSFIAQLGSRVLRREFQERIGRELVQNTVGRVNLLNAIGDPVQTVQLLQGKRPLIERDWVITRPSNLVLRGADFVARLGGVYFPGSVIPGDYFTQPQNNLSLFGQIASAFNGGRDPRITTDENGNQSSTGFGRFFGRFLTKNSPSQLFLDNTGGGQKSQLYSNLNLNRYSPDYEKSIVGEIVDVARRAINNLLDRPTKGGYYIGDKQLDASRISSPSGALPVDPFGREIIAQVYGPDKVSKQFEGTDQRFDFGLGGKSFTDSNGDLTGGLVWTSPKYNSPLIKTPYNSSNIEFKQSSILDYTQRFVTSADELSGPQRFSHAGNAIHQLSEIFNDGYKLLTKGSQIQKWSNPAKSVYNNDNIYCRIFTKEKTYSTLSNLQKTDGNIRKFTYSVLDNTYNLNIAPYKNPGSTNIVNGKVKKYMFSIENLAWRTSNRAGLTYNDLPECEKGPNGGRIMWFPPYELSFSETSSPSFKENEFLGRPEPIYTYNNTKRSGTLSWKIIVDHPSILNLIVNKELSNQSSENVNKIVDSFIAGCLKYDIYELARRWNTFRKDQLFELQQIITKASQDDLEQIKAEGKLTVKDNVTDTVPQEVSIPDFSKYDGLAFYFDNDYPDPKTQNTTTTSNYENLYNSYIGNNEYTKKGDQTKSFMDSVVKYNFEEIKKGLIKSIEEYFTIFPPDQNSGTKPGLTLELVGSASAPQTRDYNIKLSKRRISAVQNYLKNNPAISKYSDYIKIVDGGALGEGATNVSVKSSGNANVPNSFSSCSDQDTKKTDYDKVYSPNAMACRRVTIKAINPIKPEPKLNQNTVKKSTTDKKEAIIGYKPVAPKPATVSINQKIKEGISKQILRSLLSECDYFELLRENDPMFFDSMKQKIKYFHPAFHSITPEGLNSRLTFLQQCTRPGDTIPVIDLNGKPKYNNAVNTAFGAPPVLVLRIGDFFHTKIIPTSLQIGYEPLLLDLNPEGIGVQPMLAKITLQFNIVGGMGLKEPIDKLQNALSFNFYGNTEMYDERADWTDDSFKKIDEELVKKILEEQEPVTTENVETPPENNGGNTIGVITESTTTESGTTGSISYEKIMDSLHDQGKLYIDTVTGKLTEILNMHNQPILQFLGQESRYSEGSTLEFTTPKLINIYGKPKDFELSIRRTALELKRDIDEKKFNIFDLLNSRQLKDSSIRAMKSFFKTTIENESNNIISNLSMASQEIVSKQQDLVKVFQKLDLVETKKDGLIENDQNVKIYNISATTEVQDTTTTSDTYDELKTDYLAASDKLLSFYNEFLKQTNLVGKKIDYNSIDLITTGDGILDSPEEKRLFVILSKFFLNDNDRTKFINDLIIQMKIDQGEEQGIRDVFEKWFNEILGFWKKEIEEEKNFFKNNITDKLSGVWDPFVKGKKRKFLFSDQPEGSDDDKKRLKKIYMNGNSNTDSKTFNGKNKFN